MINFLKLFKLFGAISLGLFIFASVILVTNFRDRLSSEFTGGALITLRSELSLKDLQSEIAKCGSENFQLKEVSGGEGFLLRLSESFAEKAQECLKDKVSVTGSEFVSAIISEETRTKGLIGLLVALGAMLIYLSVRFEKFFALGALIALIHDVVITLGFYIFFFDRYLSLQLLISVLTLIGYSVNDTIVVFDRIREELDKEDTVNSAFNKALNLVLGRCIKTSLLTLAVVVLLIFIGGEGIADFSLFFLVGTVVGTYSSIFIAAPIVYSLLVAKKKLN
jgi:preprotein translocase subunit SecF